MPLGILPLEVVDAVGDIACLLYFGWPSRPDAVDAPGRQEEHIPPSPHIPAMASVMVSVSTISILLWGDGLLEPHPQAGFLVRLHDIPHLRFPRSACLRAVSSSGCTCMDSWSRHHKLDEQWKFVTKTLVVFRSHKRIFQVGNQFVEPVAPIRAVSYDGLIVFHTDISQLSPTFSCLMASCLKGMIFASPDVRLQKCLKFNRFHAVVFML